MSRNKVSLAFLEKISLRSSSSSSSLSESWSQVKDQILSIPIGDLKPVHRAQAVALCQQLRSHESQLLFFDDDDDDATITKKKRRDRIKDGFSLLDRLMQEHNHVMTATRAATMDNPGCVQNTNNGPPPRPLEQDVLAAILVSWRNFVVSETSPKEGPGNTKENRIVQQASLLPLNLGALAPDHVLTKVNHYLGSGLVGISPNPFNIVLHVMVHLQSDPIKGEKLLHSMLARARNVHDRYHPTELTVRLVVELWAATGGNQAPEKAEEWLGMLKSWWYQQIDGKTIRDPLGIERGGAEKQHNNNNNNTNNNKVWRPTPALYCAVIEAYTRAAKTAAQNSQPGQFPFVAIKDFSRLFSEMKQICAPNELTGVTFTRLCNALAQVDADAARIVLDEMVEMAIKQLSDKKEGMTNSFMQQYLKPLQYAFSSVISAYGRAMRPKDAQALFDRKIALSEAIPYLKADSFSFNALIWAYARAGDFDRAETVLMEMIGCHDINLEYNWLSWHGFFQSYAQEVDDPAAAAKQIRRYLDILQAKVDEGSIPKKVLHISLYNTLLSCYARQTRDAQEAVRAADQIFQWLASKSMKNNNKEQPFLNLKPTIETYTSLIFAHYHANNPEKCEQMLHQLCRAIQTREISGKLGPLLFGVVMKAWIEAEHPDRAQLVFDSMIQQHGVIPNTVIYNTLMWAWARCPQPKKRLNVERLFEQMQSRDGLDPDDISYNAMLFNMIQPTSSAFLSADEIKRAEEFFQKIPTKTAEHYNTIMTAFTRRSRPNKVESLFREFREQGEKALEPCGVPTFPMFVTRLRAWSKAGDPHRTTLVLQEMIAAYDNESHPINEPPGTAGFNTVLAAWLRSDRPEAGRNAEKFLWQMFEIEDSYHCRPDASSFTTVLSTYARSSTPKAGNRAWALLEKFKKLAKEHPNDETMQPTLMAYAETILSLIRSSKHKIQNQQSDTVMLIDDGKDVDLSVARVKHLLQELQATPKLLLDKLSTRDVLDELREEINKHWGQKSELMEQLNQVLAAIRNS